MPITVRGGRSVPRATVLALFKTKRCVGGKAIAMVTKDFKKLEQPLK